MEIPDECLGQMWLFLCEATDLLQVGATCQSWRRTSVQSDAWQSAFVLFWHRRQKAGFVRNWWHYLLDKGFAETAGLSITSSPTKLLNVWEPWKPNPFATDSTSTWYRSFVSAAWDMWTRSVPTNGELCYDFCWDERASENFPRSWCLSEGDEIDGVIGGELQFQLDKSIHAGDGCPWKWRWWQAHCCDWSYQPHWHVQLWRQTWDHRDETIEFHMCRSADAGFVMVSSDGITLRSREKTIEEHIYRRYGGEPSCPRDVRKALQNISDAAHPLNVQMPSELTSFERLCAHRHADRLGLHHLSSGVGLARSIKIFGRSLHGPVPSVHAIVGQEGIEWPASAEAEETTLQRERHLHRRNTLL